ncbi:MAG: Kelch repeat-containing protein [Myxococcota bacterium]
MIARALSHRGVLLASSLFGLFTLTGCPLSDEYSIDPNYGLGGKSAAGGGGGASAGSTNALGGSAALGGNSNIATGGAGGGQPASSGAGGGCNATTCAGACCANACVDLANDPQNCGKCANACSAGRSCSVGACTPGWLPTATPPAAFVAREKAAYTAFSGKIFIWGGIDASGKELNTGAIYNPALDSWQLTAIDSNTPTARELATAVWVGSAILVFGGRQGGSTIYRDAALYDPVANRWTQTSDNDTARAAPIAAAYSGMVVFWSGLSANLIPLAGADRYRVSTDGWWASSTTNGPPRLGHTACAGIGAYFYVYGGIDNTITKSDKAYRYAFSTNTWSTLARGPSARWDAFGATDGTRFYVWGGRDDQALRRDGSAYDTEWVTLGVSGVPSARYAPLRESGWSFDLEGVGFALLGGFDSQGVILHNGARYNAATDDWTSIPAWPSGQDHAFGVAASTGSELVVFGGRDGSALSNSGERFSF